MSVVLAVLLCRLFVTCAGVPAGFLSEGVCSTAVAVSSLVSLLASLPLPVCSRPASRARFLPVPLLATAASPLPPARACSPACVSSLPPTVVCVLLCAPASAGRVSCVVW